MEENRIKRSITPIIEETLKHFPIVLLTGPRQVGKSTLLFHEFVPKGYDYISFDDALNVGLAKADPRAFLELHKAPLIIDEAQKVPELFPELERIVNESRLKKGNLASNGMYILSGSQRTRLLEQSKESLSGRVAILDMSALSLSEILKRESQPFEIDLSKANQRSKDIKFTEEDYLSYIVRGFYPGLYADPGMDKDIFYHSYFSTFLEKDLKDIIAITDITKFIKFVRLLASNTAQELVYDHYSNEVGVTTNTIKTWTAALVKTGIIYLVEPYYENSLAKRIVKRPKVYFSDTGLVASVSPIDSVKTLQNSTMKGSLFENFVINEIRKSYQNAGLAQPLYYYRDATQNEIDLVLLREGRISCIEIKAGQNFNASYTKGFRAIEKTKYEKGKNAIVCSAPSVSILNDGTFIIPAVSI